MRNSEYLYDPDVIVALHAGKERRKLERTRAELDEKVRFLSAQNSELDSALKLSY